MSCIQRSSCTLGKCQGFTAIAFGIGIMTIIPLTIGCLGKYHVLSIGRPLSQGMIISSSLSIAALALAAIIIAICARILGNQNFSIDQVLNLIGK